MLATLACGEYVTPIPMQVANTPTPTKTRLPTLSPTIANTPEKLPTLSNTLCVSVKSVYLRPAPNADFYPIDPLLEGTEVVLLGARDGKWIFVQVSDQIGWVNSEYLSNCEDKD